MSLTQLSGEPHAAGYSFLQPSCGLGSDVSLTPDGTLVLTCLRLCSITSAPKPSPRSPPIS